MNNASVVVGWFGLSGALVLGYGAYKNKPVFGSGGIVTQAIQTGKVGTGTPGKTGGTAPGVSVPKAGTGAAIGGIVGGAILNPSIIVPTAAPVAPSPPSSPLSGLLNALKGLFGGEPTSSGVYV